MTPHDQQPYDYSLVQNDASIFASNPDPRCPCVLVLDTSGSMSGEKINSLNAGLVEFQRSVQTDEVAARRVELAIITFGPVYVANDFQTMNEFIVPHLETTGNTPMGAAVELAVDLVKNRKALYKQYGTEYYRPWIFLITDGDPTDSIQRARQLVSDGEAKKEFMFFAVGVEGADLKTLATLSTRQPLSLNGLRFQDMFQWLSKSLSAVSQSSVSDKVNLINPATPDGWASTD